MTNELLSGAAGVALSLVLSYLPGAREWYADLDGTRKRVVMLLALLAVAAGSTALSCAGIVNTMTCDQGGIVALAKALLAALVANQSTYLLSPASART